MGYIYKITNNINGKMYIGQTHNSIQQRWTGHKSKALNVEREGRYPLYEAMQKYGVENFSIEQIEECDESILDDREIYWIEKLDTYNTGYNATLGGRVGRKHSEKLIKSLWDSGLYLWQVAEESGADVHTVKSILRDYQPFIDQREKRYQEAFANKKTKAIPVLQYSMDGTFIREYKSMTEAQKELGIDKSTIMRVCKGKANYAGNYQWRYKNEENPIPVLKVSNNKYPVLQLNKDGEIIAKFESVKDAGRILGLSHNSIMHACNTNTEYNGFLWKFENEENVMSEKKRRKSYKTNESVCQPVIKIDDNGNEEYFKSVKDAMKSIDIKYPTGITDCCKGNRKTYKGYKWKYAKDKGR